MSEYRWKPRIGDILCGAADPEHSQPTAQRHPDGGKAYLQGGMTLREWANFLERKVHLLETTPQTCTWHLDDDDCNAWETECGEAFTLNHSGPVDNDMKFCCFCGRTVIEQERLCGQ